MLKTLLLTSTINKILSASNSTPEEGPPLKSLLCEMGGASDVDQPRGTTAFCLLENETYFCQINDILGTFARFEDIFKAQITFFMSYT